MAQQDPMQRLVEVERLANRLSNAYTQLSQENQSIKARLKALEIECGMHVEGAEEPDEQGIG